MARYGFRFDSAGESVSLSRARDFPSLAEALIRANAFARNLVRQQLGALIKVHGRVDIVDESDTPLARIFLADIARQMS